MERVRTVRVGFCLLVLSLLLMVSASAWAQLGTQGTFVGTVRDSSGGVVPGAVVTATNTATGVAQAVTSNDNGLYVIANLLPAHYRLDASHVGFQTEVHNDIELAVSQRQEVDFTLTIGATATTVTVTGEAPLVDTTSSTLASLVNEAQVHDLPLNGRDYAQLVLLTPGVANSTGETKPGRANPVFGITGARPSDSRYMVDGSEFAGTGTQSNSLPNTASGKLLGVDAIAEFSVSTNSGDATIGKEQGGQVNLVTRSGSNDFHGSAYEFVRSDIFNARNPFASTVPFLMRNNYGGAIGGPIKKNKAFFFSNFEQYRDREETAFSASVPTLAERGIGFGGIEQIPTPTQLNPCAVTTIDPNTGFVNGKAAGLNPAAVQASATIMNFFPLPSGSALGSNGCAATSQVANTLPLEHNQDTFYLGRVDYQMSQKQSLFARYLMQTGYRVAYVNDPFAQFPMYKPSRTQLFTLGDRYDFSNGMLNQFTASFNRGSYDILDNIQQLPSSSIPSAFSLLPGYTGPTQLGVILVGQGSGIFGPLNDNAANAEFHQVARQMFEVDDQLSKNWGKHFFQTGVQIQRILSFEAVGNNTDGNVLFSTLLGFAEGQPSQLTAVLPGSDAHRSYRQVYTGAYVQDSYRVISNFTLNLGVRWELLTNPMESYNRLLQWYPVPGGDGACPGAVCYPSFPNPFPASFSESGLSYPVTHPFTSNRSGNWAPRVGFAWNVFGSGKTSLRGGFGMYYNQLQTDWRSLSDTAPPNYIPVTITNPPWPTPGQALVGLAPGTIPAGTKLTAASIQPDPGIPTMFQYNLTVQQQIASGTLLSVAYVGSEAYHQNRATSPQMPAPIVNAAGRLQLLSQSPLNAALSTSTTGAVFDGTGSYNSMQVSLEKRLSHGLQVKAAFAWSKSLTDSPDSLGSDMTPMGIASDRSYDRGLAPFSVNKAFSLNGIYQLPLGTHQNATGLLLNGWQVSWIYLQQGGLPFRLVDGPSQTFSTGTASAGSRPDINPAFTGPVILGGPAEYFNPQAFMPAPVGTFGDAGSAELTGPGLANVDISLMKLFKLTERFGLQFRVDAFNVLNHPNWNLPNNSLFSSINCPATQSVCGPGSYTVNRQAGVATATVTDAREMQFSLKLNF